MKAPGMGDVFKNDEMFWSIAFPLMFFVIMYISLVMALSGSIHEAWKRRTIAKHSIQKRMSALLLPGRSDPTGNNSNNYRSDSNHKSNSTATRDATDTNAKGSPSTFDVLDISVSPLAHHHHHSCTHHHHHHPPQRRQQQPVYTSTQIHQTHGWCDSTLTLVPGDSMHKGCNGPASVDCHAAHSSKCAGEMLITHTMHVMTKAVLRRAVVVVGGDFARSPRMQYHAASLARSGLFDQIALVGYDAGNALSETLLHSNRRTPLCYTVINGQLRVGETDGGGLFTSAATAAGRRKGVDSSSGMRAAIGHNSNMNGSSSSDIPNYDDHSSRMRDEGDANNSNHSSSSAAADAVVSSSAVFRKRPGPVRPLAMGCVIETAYLVPDAQPPIWFRRMPHALRWLSTTLYRVVYQGLFFTLSLLRILPIRMNEHGQLIVTDVVMVQTPPAIPVILLIKYVARPVAFVYSYIMYYLFILPASWLYRDAMCEIRAQCVRQSQLPSAVVMYGSQEYHHAGYNNIINSHRKYMNTKRGDRDHGVDKADDIGAGELYRGSVELMVQLEEQRRCRMQRVLSDAAADAARPARRCVRRRLFSPLLVVDWHNYGYTIMEQNHRPWWACALYRLLEINLCRGDMNITVSDAMRRSLDDVFSGAAANGYTASTASLPASPASGNTMAPMSKRAGREAQEMRTDRTCCRDASENRIAQTTTHTSQPRRSSTDELGRRNSNHVRRHRRGRGNVPDEGADKDKHLRRVAVTPFEPIASTPDQDGNHAHVPNPAGASNPTLVFYDVAPQMFQPTSRSQFIRKVLQRMPRTVDTSAAAEASEAAARHETQSSLSESKTAEAKGGVWGIAPPPDWFLASCSSAPVMDDNVCGCDAHHAGSYTHSSPSPVSDDPVTLEHREEERFLHRVDDGHDVVYADSSHSRSRSRSNNNNNRSSTRNSNANGAPENDTRRGLMIVASTSWTPDDDYSILVEALQRLDSRLAHAQCCTAASSTRESTTRSNSRVSGTSQGNGDGVLGQQQQQHQQQGSSCDSGMHSPSPRSTSYEGCPHRGDGQVRSNHNNKNKANNIISNSNSNDNDDCGGDTSVFERVVSDTNDASVARSVAAAAAVLRLPLPRAPHLSQGDDTSSPAEATDSPHNSTVEVDRAIDAIMMQQHQHQQQQQQQRATDGAELINLWVLVTGKGPSRQRFERAIVAAKLSSRIVVSTVYLQSYADYSLAVGAADVGLCLHFSSSRLDLPMKAIDMIGAGIPVMAFYYPAIEELMNDRRGVGYCDEKDSEPRQPRFASSQPGHPDKPRIAGANSSATCSSCSDSISYGAQSAARSDREKHVCCRYPDKGMREMEVARRGSRTKSRPCQASCARVACSPSPGVVECERGWLFSSAQDLEQLLGHFLGLNAPVWREVFELSAPSYPCSPAAAAAATVSGRGMWVRRGKSNGGVDDKDVVEGCGLSSSLSQVRARTLKLKESALDWESSWNSVLLPAIHANL